MPFDKWGHPFFYPSKTSGFFYQMSDNPKNDQYADWPSEMSFDGGGIVTMRPNGPTDFGLGKNIANFNDAIGGCNMDFAQTAERGYAYKADDARDVELKCIMKVDGTGDNGFSISACTGAHHSGGRCCQGCAYMITMEPSQNPTEFRFRKEMWHVSYHDAPLGMFTHPKANFKIEGSGRWIGLGFCRYNDPNNADTVIVEVWYNPDPDSNKNDWTMLKRFSDAHGVGWGNDGDDCNGFKDQPLTWSSAQNRFKTNASNGTVKFKQVSMREIDPTGDFGGGPDPNEPPPSGGGSNSVVRKIHWNIVRGQSPQDLKGIMRTLTEELVETQTSPNPGGDLGAESFKDYDESPPGSGGGEIGDLCDSHSPVASQYASGLWVQPYWSNNDANCVAPGVDEIDLGGSSRVTNQQGGVVMKHPTLYLVYWGADWRDRVSTPTAAEVTDLVQNKLLVTDAQYFSKLSQYGQVGVPVWGKAVFNTTTAVPGGSAVTQSQAINALRDAFNNRLLEIPNDNEDKIYIIITPYGKTFTTDGGGTGSVGLHGVQRMTLTTTTTQPPPSTQLAYTFSSKFGTKGNGNGQFQDPHDITFDEPGDNLWVCDRVRNDIQKFTSAGVFVSKFGSSGSGNGQFNVPYALQINPAFTHLYVCDRENNRVQKLTTAGAWVSNITSAGGKSFNKPEDICFNSSTGDIFICDTGNNRVVKLDSSHNFLLEWDGSSGGTKFDHPHSMDITVDNTHIIMSCGNQPFIQKYTTSGTFVKKWGSEGNGQGQVRMFLEHGDIDAFGRFHLINNDVRPIINVWDEDGTWLCQYGKTTSGSADGQFKEPEHVTVHPNGNPYVVDAKNQRIQIFTPNITDTNPPPPVTPPPSGGGGGGVSKITGSFTILSDINITRVSACEGVAGGGGGGGGGSGGSARFYDGEDPDNDKAMGDIAGTPWDNRIRVAQKCIKSTSLMKGKVLKQLNVALKKVGSPPSTPVIQAKIWGSDGTTVRATSSTNFDPSTLTTSYPADDDNWAAFDFSSNTYAIQVGDRVGVEWLGTDEDNYIVVGYESDTESGGGKSLQSQYEDDPPAWDDKTTRDLAAVMWE